MNVVFLGIDPEYPIPNSDDKVILISTTFEDGTGKYLKIGKPFTRNELSAALHHFADNIKE